jgi:hypothetical protein
MSNGNQNVPPGLMQPTMTSFVPGAGNPRDSALMMQQQMNAKQQSLNNAVGGRRRRLKGGNNGIVVPQFQMQYSPTGGPGTNPNDQVKGLSSTSMQSTAWAANDNLATKMGGTRKKRRGGCGDWSWGCYSGGKRTRGRKSRRKSRRSRYCRRH